MPGFGLPLHPPFGGKGGGKGLMHPAFGKGGGKGGAPLPVNKVGSNGRVQFLARLGAGAYAECWRCGPCSQLY